MLWKLFKVIAIREVYGNNSKIILVLAGQMIFLEKKIPEYYQINKQIFESIRDTPVLIRENVRSKDSAKMNKQNVKSYLPNLDVQAARSLNEKVCISSTQKKYYCKLHDFLDYCEGEKVEFLVSSGNFDHKKESYSKEDLSLYVLNLNCNRRKDLSDLVCIDEIFGDWFQKYYPKYTQYIVYDKGHTWFFIGPEGSISQLHYDHNNVHTTLQQYRGKKEVFLLDPVLTNKLIQKKGYTIEFIKENGEIRIKGCEDFDNKEITLPIYYGLLNARDTLYIPCNWGHMVRSIEPSITISRDFIDDRNADSYFTSILLSSRQDSMSKKSENI